MEFTHGLGKVFKTSELEEFLNELNSAGHPNFNAVLGPFSKKREDMSDDSSCDLGQRAAGSPLLNLPTNLQLPEWRRGRRSPTEYEAVPDYLTIRPRKRCRHWLSSSLIAKPITYGDGVPTAGFPRSQKT